MLLLGVQGCGKSLLAKAVAGGFGVPLVRLDFGTLYDKFHGETEKNLRDALASAEQLAPCVLWIDEIEKGLATDGGDGDGGVSRRVLGYLLTWMAERKARGVPGRHRQPGAAAAARNCCARAASTRSSSSTCPMPPPAPRSSPCTWTGASWRREHIDLSALAAAAEGYSGAEIEQVIVSALYAAHAAQAGLDTHALMQAIRDTRPLSVLMAEQVQALREWALPRTVPAD